MLTDAVLMSEQWQQIKTYVETAMVLSRDSLHIYAALGVQLLAAWLLSRSLRSMIPWAIVLVVILANELFDMAQFLKMDHIPIDYWPNAIHDIWNTMFLPTILLLVVRYGPHSMFSKGG